MPSLDSNYLDRLSFTAAHISIIQRLGEARGRQDQVRGAVARRLGAFNISDIERDCPAVSRDMVRHVLRQMRAEGLVHVEGRGRGARWRATAR